MYFFLESSLKKIIHVLQRNTFRLQICHWGWTCSCSRAWDRNRDTPIRDDVTVSQWKRCHGWCISDWHKENCRGFIFVMSATWSIYHSVSTCHSLKYRDQDCFEDDVIHPPVSHLSDCHKKLSVWLPVYLAPDSCNFFSFCKRGNVSLNCSKLGFGLNF